ncbi:MAG: tetratricopeptide repeat protein [Hydrotalea sp.]|nr:tetratricopeptide repeat protein [Hydrotalea sp.]
MRKFLLLSLIGLGGLMAACASVPDAGDGFYSHGLETMNNNDPETGLEYKDVVLLFDEAIRLKPNDYRALVRRGDVAMQYRQFNDAAVYYGRAIAVKPKNYDIYNKRGEAYFRLAKYQPAMVDFQRALTLNPGDATAPLNLCYLFVAARQFKNAGRYCDRVLAIEPGNPYAAQLKSMMAKGRGQ